jgi:hypothetical protein
MSQQPDGLTLETVQVAARNFAMLVNSGALTIPKPVPRRQSTLKVAFIHYLSERFQLLLSRLSLDHSARLPHVNVTIVVSSVPLGMFNITYQSADQRIFGLETDLLLFAKRPTRQFGYPELRKDPTPRPVAIERVLYVRQERTADREATERINAILDEQPPGESGRDELMGYIASLSPHLTRAERGLLADRILAQRPQVGALHFLQPHWMVQPPRQPTSDGVIDLLDAAHEVEDRSTNREPGGHDQPEM